MVLANMNGRRWRNTAGCRGVHSEVGQTQIQFLCVVCSITTLTMILFVRNAVTSLTGYEPPVVKAVGGQDKTEGAPDKTTDGNEGARGVDLNDRNKPAPNDPVDDARIVVHHSVRHHASAGAATERCYAVLGVASRYGSVENQVRRRPVGQVVGGGAVTGGGDGA